MMMNNIERAKILEAEYRRMGFSRLALLANKAGQVLEKKYVENSGEKIINLEERKKTKNK